MRAPATPKPPEIAELAARLIRYDTTNPPGEESACIGYVAELLGRFGIDCELHAADPNRPNLIARVSGTGAAPPVLVHGHVDVVGTSGQQWQHPPFEARLVDDVLWGRGAMDMKGPVAAMLRAVIDIKLAGGPPKGDVVLAVLSDEEAAAINGSRFLVEDRPELFKDIRYSIGEGGGESVDLLGHRVHPIAVAEKRICWMRATVRGVGGHGSMPVSGSTIGTLARVLHNLDNLRAPFQVSEAARVMFTSLAQLMPGDMGCALQDALDPDQSPEALAALGATRLLGPLLRDTVAVTTVHGGDKINVIPAEVTIELDGRTCPDSSPDELMALVRSAAGPEVDLELIQGDSGSNDVDLRHFGSLTAIIDDISGQAPSVPALMGAFTDGSQFSRLGIQNYGFLPCVLDFDWLGTIHGADERVPVAALEQMSEGIRRALITMSSDE